MNDELEKAIQLFRNAFLKIIKSHSRSFKQKFELKFNGDKFKIVQFTDLHQHFGESEENKNTVILMDDILNSEKPDLVIITGDCIDGRYCLTEQDVRGAIDSIAKPMEDRKIPWAVVLGNHDNERSLVDRRKQMKIYMSYKYNLSQIFSTVIGRAGDYNLLIKDVSNNAIYNLYMIDSGSYDIGGYGYIKTEQINWYKKVSNNLKKRYGKIIPSIMFFHIPLKQQYEVWQSGKAIGERNEKETYQSVDTGLFNTIKSNGDVKAVFVGHDHNNDYYGNLGGITLGYGRKSGYNCYGKTGFKKGARIIILDKNNLDKFNTYEILEK